jgi:hypothetical protein
VEQARESLIVLLAVPLVALLAGASLRWPPREHVLVVSRRGVVRRVVGGGPTWRWPLLDRVEAVPTVPEPIAVSVRATTRDGHEVRLLAEAEAAVELPLPGDPADAVRRARVSAEEELSVELAASVAQHDVVDLGRWEVRGLTVVELDVVLR